MTTLCLEDYAQPRQPISSGEMAIIRSIVHVIGTQWRCSPVLITQARRAALDAIADGCTPADAIHRAIDVLSGMPRTH